MIAFISIVITNNNVLSLGFDLQNALASFSVDGSFYCSPALLSILGFILLHISPLQVSANL